jgi:hypothetical protein
MLPSEQLELAIYQSIKRLPGPRFDVSMPMLSQATNEMDHSAIAERLKDLEDDGRICLSKYSSDQIYPRGDSAGGPAFFVGTKFNVGALSFAYCAKGGNPKCQRRVVLISCPQQNHIVHAASSPTLAKNARMGHPQ